MLNFEVASFSSFLDIPKNSFMMAAEVDIDYSIKRKRICVSLINAGILQQIVP